MNRRAEIEQTPAAKAWKKVGIRHHHGIDVPLFSLHSQKSCGIGEYPDLIPLIKWCKEVGLDVIQLLPLNDTGYDTSPYSAISAYALNPWHLGLYDLPYLQNFPHLKQKIKELNGLCKSQRIDYQKVYKEKEAFLREYFQQAFSLVTSDQEYQTFLKANKEWLEAYANYKASKYDDEQNYHYFLQFLCVKQLSEVKKTAEEHGVFLKGDVPILINRESVDTWQHPELFLKEYSAGSPPDWFTLDGQDWGFPIYNWDELEKQDYRWWKKRLELAGQFYHIYRLDHIVGFYRIFAIPAGLTPKEGIFIPEDETTWVGHGEKILRMMLKESSMLPIGEDLAVIPDSIRESLRKLGICGTKVIRWEYIENEYKNYQDYITESMTTVSTHDADTVQLWWRYYPDEAKAFANFKGWEYTNDLSINNHREILKDSHHTSSLFHINLLNEYFVLIPGMTWDDPDDERINYPGTVSDRNWTLRFRPSVEEIVSNQQLRDEIKQIIL